MTEHTAAQMTFAAAPSTVIVNLDPSFSRSISQLADATSFDIKSSFKAKCPSDYLISA